jgi:hypothetical protein
VKPEGAAGKPKKVGCHPHHKWAESDQDGHPDRVKAKKGRQESERRNAGLVIKMTLKYISGGSGTYRHNNARELVWTPKKERITADTHD